MMYIVNQVRYFMKYWYMVGPLEGRSIEKSWRMDLIIRDKKAIILGFVG